MNVVDRLVGFFNPDAGLRRKRARVLLERAYEGAVIADWKPRRAGASANSDHRADARMLRFRARALYQNVPYVRRGINGLVNHTIGTGITPQSDSPVAEHRATLDREFERWAKRADADGIYDFYGLQAAAYRAMEIDGEVLIRRRTRRPGDGLRVPLQIQLLEIDWLDSDRQGTVGQGGVIVNGIQYDAIGRVQGYWLFDQHPGDTQRVGRGSSRLVPASEILHLFAPERPGQGRGISRLSAIIARVRDLMLYEDAELQRKNLETRLSVLVSGAEASDLANPSDVPRGMGVDAMGTAPNAAAVDATGDLGALASGGITQLPPGMNIETVAPTVSTGYVEYLKANLHLVAAGMDVPYEVMTGDMREVNFSSARIRWNDFRQSVEQMQWLVLVPRLGNPLWAWFVDAAKTAGLVPESATDDVEWSTPRWDYVNPHQDIKAETEAIAAGLLTQSESLRRRGYKPAKVFAEMGSDYEAMRASGALGMMAFMGNRPPPPEVDDAEDDNTTGTPPTDGRGPPRTTGSRAARESEAAALVREFGAALQAQAATGQANAQAFADGIRALADRPVNLHVAAPAVTVEPAQVRVDVAPTTVHVPAAEVRVDVAGATVHVEPTPVEVRVENRVETPDVTVTPEITVHLPDRETVTDIERDAAGEIVRTVKIETTKDSP